MNYPWEADISLSAVEAKRIIEARFPRLRLLRLKPAGGGWDNILFEGDGWVFRFPRRREAIALLATEARVLPRLANQLSTTIPIPALHSGPGSGSSWAFCSYRKIPGRSAGRCSLSTAARESLAGPLAGFLRELHQIPINQAREWGVPEDRLGRLDLSSRLPRLRKSLRRLRQAGVVQKSEPWLDLVEPFSQSAPAPVLVHGDLHIQHLLIQKGRLRGVVDWGDVHVGAAAVDLSLACTLLSPGARARFCRVYGPVSESQWLAARSRAVFVNALLGAYALDTGDRTLLAEARMGLDNLLLH